MRKGSLFNDPGKDMAGWKGHPTWAFHQRGDGGSLWKFVCGFFFFLSGNITPKETGSAIVLSISTIICS